MKLILGSASPRRRDLLSQIGVVPDEICAADIDETPLKSELPRPYVERMAREKARGAKNKVTLIADKRNNAVLVTGEELQQHGSIFFVANQM